MTNLLILPSNSDQLSNTHADNLSTIYNDNVHRVVRENRYGMAEHHPERNIVPTNLASFVLTNIKYELLHKLSQPILRSRFLNSGMEGFDSSELVVKTKCDLHTFISIATSMNIPGISSSSQCTRLNPSSNAFQAPSRATKSLSVDFQGMSHLLNVLHIMDSSDHQNAGLKTTNKTGQGMLRLLGSKCVLTFNRILGSESPVEVDCIIPFHSCTFIQLSQLQSAVRKHLENEQKTTNQHDCMEETDYSTNVIFYRTRVNYDESQGRYLSPWKATYLSLPFFKLSSTTEYEGYHKEDSTFSFVWTRSIPISPFQWSVDATFMGLQVVGELSIFLPSLTFFGSSTISEIKDLLSIHY